MKIAFVSGVKFGHDILETLLENRFEISAVFSYENSKKKFYSDFKSFDQITEQNKIFHKKVNKINDQENVDLLKKINPDLILVMGWSQLLKNELLEIPKIGVIGSHPTELPKYRGRAPIPWTIIKDLKKSALTFFWMDPGIDSGDIVDQNFFDITDDDDATTLYRRITELGKKMIIHNLTKFSKGEFPRVPQDESNYIENWEKRTLEDGKINWEQSSTLIHKLIRATTTPYPGAFTTFNNQTIKIWSATKSTNFKHTPGEIIEVTDLGVKIGTGDGSIILQTVSINEGNKTNSSKIFSKNDVGCLLK